MARPYALIAGIGYVLLFALGIFANFFVMESLVIDGDAAQTAANIAGSAGMFRWGIAAFLAIVVVDIVVAWALYALFRRVDHELSTAAAWFRVIYSALLGVAAVSLVGALQLASAVESVADDLPQLEAQIMSSVGAFNTTWLVGLLLFGVHLGLLGWLVLKSGAASRMLGYLLIVAGAAYGIDTAAHTMLPNYLDYEAAFAAMVAIPAVIAEGWMAFWLLTRGRKLANPSSIEAV